MTQYMEQIAATMPTVSHNPVQTASWNIGFMKAVMAGADWRQAEDAAWAEWRMAMDEKAAAAYVDVFDRTGNRKQAMAAFWRACPRNIPRPQEKIKSIHGATGLTLESGRVINWYVAKLKISNGELDLGGDVKPRLAAKLTELNCGAEIVPLLA